MSVTTEKDTSLKAECWEAMFKDYPDVMDVKQVMSALNICRSSVYSLIKSGDLQHIQIGRVYKIPKVALIKYLNQI